MFVAVGVIASLAPGNGVCVADETDVTRRDLIQEIDQVRELIAAGEWVTAAQRFDAVWAIVSTGTDQVLSIRTNDLDELPSGANEVTAGARARLESVFDGSPSPFRREYERQFGQTARQQLLAAVRGRDPSAIRNAADRYLFTAAANDGFLLLARQQMDRGDSLEAALLLTGIQRRVQNADPGIQLQLAMAFWDAGLNADAEDVLRQLVADSAGEEVGHSGTVVVVPQTMDEAGEWLQALARREGGHSPEPGDYSVPRWPQTRGNSRRTQLQPTGPVRLKKAWQSSLFEVHDILFEDDLNPVLQEVAAYVDTTRNRAQLNDITLSPAGEPLLAGDLLILRTVCGARAVDRATGELVWEITQPDSQLRRLTTEWKRNRAAEGWESDAAQRRSLTLELFQQQARTNQAGQMSTGARRLFLCEDSSTVTWDAQTGIVEAGSDVLPANYIRAYDLESGLFLWEAGGRRGATAPSGGMANTLAGFFFLGPPLVLGDRYYVLAESGEGIFLLQIADPARYPNDQSHNPRVLRSQLLTVPTWPLTRHPVRKFAGLMPSFAQGLLICPTSDERIVAISALDHSVRWIYRYRGLVKAVDFGIENPILEGASGYMQSKNVDLKLRWTDSLPRISADRVIITPRDSAQLHCLDLQTGRQIWAVPRGQYHTVSGITSGKVIVHGNNEVAALSLEDGSLVWSSGVREGYVTGRAIVNESLIQLPTSERRIVSLRTSDGRRLVSQEAESVVRPGNLISDGTRIYSQNLTTLECYQSVPVSPEAAPSQVAMYESQAALLNELPDRAIDILRQFLEQEAKAVPAEAQALAEINQLLIDTLLESIRTDYTASRRHIPYLRTLIGRRAGDDAVTSRLLATLIGAGPVDVAVMPVELERTEQRRRQLAYLGELVARGLSTKYDEPLPELIASIRDLLPSMIDAQSDHVSSGFLTRRYVQLLSAEIRKAIQSRSVAEQQEISTQLKPEVQRLVLECKEVGQSLQFLRCLSRSGLDDAITETLHDPEAIPGLDPLDRDLLLEQSALGSLQSELQASDAAEALLEQWAGRSRTDRIQSFRRELELSRTATLRPVAASMRIADREAVRTRLNEWLATHPEHLNPPPGPFSGVPKVTDSDDRTMLPPGFGQSPFPIANLPLLGPTGLFRGWSFVQESREGLIEAYDETGNRRWQYDPGRIEAPLSSSRLSDRYVQVCGEIAVIKLYSRIHVLDVARTGPDQPPRLLWSLDLSELTGDQTIRFRPPEESLNRYSQHLAAWFPCGPISAGEIPVISDGRIVVLDTITGMRLWTLDGLPGDAELLGDDERLIVVSESTQQIQVRNRLDGELIVVRPIPQWWGEAAQSIGTSIRDLELEPGRPVLWRLATVGYSVLIHQVSTDGCAVELRNLLTGDTEWSVSLPEDSVVSNVAEDVVAVLSDARVLRILQIDSGTELCRLNVSPSPAARELYLRPCMDRLVVLPESVTDADEQFENLLPVTDGIHVHGHIYGIDRTTMELAWERPVQHHHIRRLSPDQPPILPNVPLLVLISRERQDNGMGFGPSFHHAEVIDVHSGKTLYAPELNVGMTLNNHWMRLDPEHQAVVLSFERRFATFEYAPDAE
ncbi:MAG: PQQ-binding-like beta-propeller repeat protein [Planctomycetaceae bacterium]|nr:PQQ-binding-like beta-propeller repeat protein [Planctomycetaceae bacterium]